jgi:hypothetical protein
VFEPLKMFSNMKDHIVEQINQSSLTRGRIMLVSRAIGALLKNPIIDRSCELAVSILRTDIDQKTTLYLSERTSHESGTIREKALGMLLDYFDVRKWW